MKSTGIVRKIDELGRIVIPKEIRKYLNIHNGEDIQISVEEEKIILKKHQKMSSINEIAQKYIDSFNKLSNSKYYITDKEKVIASSEKEIINSKIDDKIEESMNERRNISGKKLNLGKELNEFFLIEPIINDADAIGTIIVVNNYEINEQDKIIINVIKILLQSVLY